MDPRRRLRLSTAAFLLAAAIVFGRAVQLEVSQGTAFRKRAARLPACRREVEGVRGRVLARNGAVLAENASAAIVVEIEGQADRSPGTRAVSRRRYPLGPLAAHVVGNVGQSGIERQCDSLLRAGRDIVLTLDPELQATAESLLDAKTSEVSKTSEVCAGGAVVVLDVHSGAILAAASAPRFDLNAMAGADPARAAAILSDPRHPLFDRVCRMAIPPGSVFKTVAAVAFLEAGTIDSKTSLACRGYLKEPDHWRCAVYRRSGVGHGQVTLVDALAQSCNVFFFHYADRLPRGLLAAWAERFGFGRPTGIDLPQEARGNVPGSVDGRPESHGTSPADTKLLVIGQGEFQATPLQVVRMMAAVANGGLLVTPHVVNHVKPAQPPATGAEAVAQETVDDAFPTPPPQPIPGLSPATLKTVREGLERVVGDAKGTARATVAIPSLPIAGKTGTAETGPGRLEHAWFAGYVPADRPKVALAVVLEHAGDAAETACPVAKQLILRMQELGYFGKPNSHRK